nr:zinc finger CCCH domain-containing protein 13-like [Oncorhynchus nerka]
MKTVSTLCRLTGHCNNTDLCFCLIHAESRGKREKDGTRDDRDYEVAETSSSRDAAREDRETKEGRERRGDGRSDRRGDSTSTSRDPTRDRDRDTKDSTREPRTTETTSTRSGRDPLEYRDREREREREKEKERERERGEREKTDRKEEAVPEEGRGYGRGHGREEGGRTEGKGETRTESRAERPGRGRGREADASDKVSSGSTRNARGSQLESGGHDGWESRSGGGFREKSAERSTDRGAERGGAERGGAERDRYDGDRRGGEQATGRDSSYDRRGGHTDRGDRRENRERGEENKYISSII